MSNPPQQEVGPATVLVSIVVALLVVFLAYSILLGPKKAPADPATAAPVAASTSG